MLSFKTLALYKINTYSYKYIYKKKTVWYDTVFKSHNHFI